MWRGICRSAGTSTGDAGLGKRERERETRTARGGGGVASEQSVVAPLNQPSSSATQCPWPRVCGRVETRLYVARVDNSLAHLGVVQLSEGADVSFGYIQSANVQSPQSASNSNNTVWLPSYLGDLWRLTVGYKPTSVGLRWCVSVRAGCSSSSCRPDLVKSPTQA